MQIVIEHEGTQREVDLQLEDPHATVGDLVEAAGGSEDLGIAVDGRHFPRDHGLDEVNLHEGAVVHLSADAPVPPEAKQGPLLAVVDGPTAGITIPLDGERVRIGRGPDCELSLPDLTLSTHHAEIARDAAGDRFTVADADSHNGTWLDEEPVAAPTTISPGALLRLGATHLQVLADLPDDRPLAVDPLHRAVGGLVPFNRPPRPALPGKPEAMAAPAAPEPSKRNRTLSIVSIIAPIILGTALVIIYGNPRFALFLLLSPVIAIGNWLSGRRQAKKEHVASSKEFRKALDALDAELAASAAQEQRRRELLLPHLAEVTRRVRQPSTQLWQRRPGHDDFLRLRCGLGTVRWEPPVEAGREGPAPEVVEAIERHASLPRAPVEVDLSGGGVVGLVGDRTAALALARSLVVQAAAHHGPADLGLAVLPADEHATSWDWAKWLPHVRDVTGATRLLASGRARADALLGALLDARGPDDRSPMRLRGDVPPAGRTLLYVLDDVGLTQGRRAPARLALRGEAGPAAGIVIAETEDQLPAVTTTVVHLNSELGDADLRRPQEGTQIDDFVISGLTEPVARDLARTLARYEDPELEVVGAGVPHGVRLLAILGTDEIDAGMVTAAWGEGLPDPGPNTPIGVGEDGIVHLDLTTDGPHGLIGGTTGSGKSELLRSMVAGMAARVDPDHLVFVLVDYKGGSAFDECAKLPHTVGMVTDLDEHLGERALTSLEAELHHRERLLREAGAQDLPEYAKLGAPLGALPRLVVVVDEFATLASELPDFLGALVGIAQRGRSLGVHMILATQRPQGAVNANIKANTNLRVALRVQDAGDSNDIIDRPDAASISRSNPGRAYIRLGPTDVVLVQTALSTATASQRRSAAVRLAPFVFGPVPSIAVDTTDGDDDGPTDLARLVTACNEAFDRSAMDAPRRPWLPMLDEHVKLDEVLAHPDASPDGVVFGLADEPKQQRRRPVAWTPSEGHLGLFGMVGSGTTTALLAVARSLAERFTPDECHLYALDFGAGGLAPLSALPHTGGVIGANDGEGQHRLVRTLRRELDRRRDLGLDALADEPLVVVAIDGIGAFLAEHESAEGADVGDWFRRVFADGPTVRIVCVVTGDRVGELPLRMSSLVARKLLFRHADPAEFATVGIRTKSLPQFVPGRALDADSGLVMQVGHPGDDLEAQARALADAAPPGVRPPVVLRALPTDLTVEQVDAVTQLEPPPLRVPVGLAEEDLGPVALELHPTDHALVIGPPRSGKSSALMTIAAQIRAADPGTVVMALCDERSPLYGYDPLDAAGALSDLVAIVKASVTDDRRWFILVDDAPLTDDVEGALAAVLRAQRPGLHVIAAGRTDDLRGSFSHWTRGARQSRTGLLLQPNLAADGELFSLRLPRRTPVSLASPGRGFVINAGEATLAQVAVPPDLP